MEPPTHIDGALVLEWAWSDSPFGYVGSPNDPQAGSIYGLAICRYENSNTIYRFSCDHSWNTSQDAEYSSIHEAKELLPDQYRLVPATWRRTA